MKKTNITKIIAISLLGLLLLVPFMKPASAQVPSYVGVTEGQHEEWDLYIYTTGGEWDQWFLDNMTDPWAIAFGQTFMDNMTSVFDTAAKVPDPPQATLFYTVESIQPDTGGLDANSDSGITPDETFALPGTTLVNMSAASGTFMDFSGWPYYSYFANGTGIFISNTTEQYAEDIGYGAMATSAIWASNMFNTANNADFGPAFDANYTNTILFAPNNVNWTVFAAECNLYLALPVWAATGYTSNIIKFDALANGFTISSENNTFGTNSVNITITCTYDANGLLTYHGFEYGSDTLVEIFYADSTYPVITAASSDFSVPFGYTGVTINWTATDANAGDYAILIDDVADVYPTSWTSGAEIQYAVADGLAAGNYTFKINFGDTRPNRPNVVSSEVIMTVLPAPVAPQIPGFDPFIVMGLLTAMTAGAIILMKKKKKKLV